MFSHLASRDPRPRRNRESRSSVSSREVLSEAWLVLRPGGREMQALSRRGEIPESQFWEVSFELTFKTAMLWRGHPVVMQRSLGLSSCGSISVRTALVGVGAKAAAVVSRCSRFC